MNATNKQNSANYHVCHCCGLLLLFGGGAITGATLRGGMMGNGAMGGIS
jgi:hypothetical protein